MAARETPTQKITDVTTRVAIIEREIANLAGLLKRVDIIVEGDGATSGMNSRVQNLEYEVIRIRAELTAHTQEYQAAKLEKKQNEKEDANRRLKNLDTLTTSIIVLILSNVIGVIIDLLRK